MVSDLSQPSTIKKPITVWIIWNNSHAIGLNQRGQRWCSCSPCSCCSICSCCRITLLLDQVVFSHWPSPLSLNSLALILYSSIILIISLIPFQTLVVPTTIDTFHSLHCIEMGIWNKLGEFFECGLPLEDLVDDHIRHGGGHGIVAKNVLWSKILRIVPQDHTNVVVNEFQVTHDGDCDCSVWITIAVCR